MEERDKCHAVHEATIRQFGWMIQHTSLDVDNDRPPYSYTIGLHDQGYPEIVIVGVPADVGQLLMQDVVTAMKALPHAGHFRGRIELPKWEYPFYILEPDMDLVARDYAQLAAIRSKGRATYLHVCLTDAYGVFPWQPGFDRRLEHSVFLLGPAPQLN